MNSASALLMNRSLPLQARLRTSHTGWRTMQQQRQATTSASVAAAASSGSVKIAIIGDVHDQWTEADARALRFLQPDMALFVGDFGNEVVPLVRSIAELDVPKAVILGNHDAWYTMSVQRAKQAQKARKAAGDAGSEGGANNVELQLQALGSSHVGYSTLQLGSHPLTVAGARPFSKGGDSFSSIQAFMSSMYGLDSFQASADRIVQEALKVPSHHSLLLIAHNGPHGLGDRRHDICGVDFARGAGDHGDTDLAEALARLQGEHGRHVALVAFGHMHAYLKGGGLRNMVHVDPGSGTVVLNAATVPRVKPSKGSRSGATLHHFLTVELQQQAHVQEAAAAAAGSGAVPGEDGPGSSGTYVVQRAEEVWVEVEPLKALGSRGDGSSSSSSSSSTAGSSSEGSSDGGASAPGAAGCRLADSRLRVKAIAGEKGVVVMAWQAHQQQLVPVILSPEASARYSRAGEDDGEGEGDGSEAEQQQVQQVAGLAS